MNSLNGLLNIFGKAPVESEECLASTIETLVVPNPHHQIYIGLGMKGNIKEPHIHVFRSGNDCLNWIRGVPLSLIRNNYILHDSKFIGLSEKELCEINKYLRRTTKMELNSTITTVQVWDMLMSLWNHYNKNNTVAITKYHIPLYDFNSIKKGRSIL